MGRGQRRLERDAVRHRRHRQFRRATQDLQDQIEIDDSAAQRAVAPSRRMMDFAISCSAETPPVTAPLRGVARLVSAPWRVEALYVTPRSGRIARVRIFNAQRQVEPPFCYAIGTELTIVADFVAPGSLVGLLSGRLL